jgi:hypothetical protein
MVPPPVIQTCPETFLCRHRRPLLHRGADLLTDPKEVIHAVFGPLAKCGSDRLDRRDKRSVEA